MHPLTVMALPWATANMTLYANAAAASLWWYSWSAGPYTNRRKK